MNPTARDGLSRFFPKQPIRRSFLHTALWMAALPLLLAACGGGGGGGDGGSTGPASITATIFLDETIFVAGSTGGFIAQKPVGDVTDVVSVGLTYTDLTLGGPPVEEELTFEPLIGAYTRTLTGLTLGDDYEFSAKAYDTAALIGLVIFDTPTPVTQTPLLAGDKIVLNLGIVNDGTPFAFPRVSTIAINPNPMLPGSATTEVDITLSTGDGSPVVGVDEVLDWELGGDPTKGMFLEYNLGCTATPITTGQATIATGLSETTFKVCYKAPSAEGFYSKTVKVTNAAGDSVTVTFFFAVDLSVLNSGILVFTPPAIWTIGGQRTGYHDLLMSATVVDDKPTDTLSYQWSFVADVNPAFATYMTFPTPDSNPGTLVNYGPDLGGLLTLTVTDLDGASSTVSVPLPQNLFPDAVAPLGPYKAVRVDGGNTHTCAVLAGGNVSCWGSNSNGKLGDNSSTQRLRQVLVVDDPATGALLQGIVGPIASSSEHNCAIDNVGTVNCWGNGSSGELGHGLTPSTQTTAVQANLASPAIDVSVGIENTCALVTGGGVFCWGDNFYGQIGDNGNTPTNVNSSSPVATVITGTDPLKATDIASGQYFTCALMGGTGNTGEVWCWGRNNRGQLGIGSTNTTPNENPQPVQDGAGGNLTGVTAITANFEHACALLGDTRVKCWGFNSSGQIGFNGTATPTNVTAAETVLVDLTPTDLTGVQKVSAGGAHTCALMTDQTINCWGNNTNGRLGDGTITTRFFPTQVHYFPGVDIFTDMNAGNSHTCAVLIGGNMRCWGSNNNGQVGEGSTTERRWPIGVDYLDFMF